MKRQETVIEEIRTALREQWEEGYAAAEKEVGITWKNFNEEKPENRVPVLIVYEFVGTRYTSEGEWHRAHHQFLDYRFKEFIDEKEVVAWSPMPKFHGFK